MSASAAPGGTPGEAGAVHGSIAPGFEAVAEAFARNVSERGEVGAAFAAVVDGEPAVDLWGGMADRDRGCPWERDTIAGLFSGTKGLVATCLLLLIERGALALEQPVAAYWPEFGAQGKRQVLVRHLVSHQAGLPGLTTPVTAEEAADDRRMAALLAAQPALARPGGSFWYHALTFGWLCGELIRRVDGRSVGRLLHDEVAVPLGLDAWIGLPEREEPRVAVLVREQGFGSQPRDRDASAGDPVAWSIWANPPRFATEPLPANERFWHAAEIPGSNGIASARAMARLYGCLARGGEIDGVQLLSPPAVALGARHIVARVDPFLRKPMAFGIGFQLQTQAAPFGPAPVAFGHPGTGGSVHGAWPHARTGFSYVTNALFEREGPDPRAAALLDALHEALRARRSAR